MATVVNTRDVLLLAASPRLLWTGVRGVSVVANTTSFKVVSGSPTPSSITLTATLNGVNGSVVWSVPFGTATLSPSGTSCTLIYSNMTSSVITVRATVTDNGIPWSANITLTKVADGDTGATGIAGATGAAGDKSRIAYSLIDGFTLSSSPSSVVVSGDTVPSTGTWGETRAWTASPSTASVGQAVFQTTGTYNPTTNQTTWVVPYLSNLKVGTLSAIVTNTGELVINSNGSIRGGQTSYDSGDGFFLGDQSGYKFSVGNSNNRLTYNGSLLQVVGHAGFLTFGANSASSVAKISREASTFLPAVYISDSSASLTPALCASNSASFAGDTMVSFVATKGTALFTNTLDSTRWGGVFQNNGSGKALAVAGTTYSGYAGTGNGVMNIVDGYLPFTGIHISIIEKDVVCETGDIVHTVKVILKNDVSNTLLQVALTNALNKKSVFGVINKVIKTIDNKEELCYNYQDTFDCVHVNAVGEGCINVCGLNGDIESGDLITSSSLIGKGMKQSDDLVRNYTVAKSTEDVTFDYPEQVKQIACTYMCG